MNQEPPKPFDFDDLPDRITQAEALWHLHGLTYLHALHRGYLTLMDEPDYKAAEIIEKSLFHARRSAVRAFGEGEAEFLEVIAVMKAKEGVEAQRKAQEGSASPKDRTQPTQH